MISIYVSVLHTMRWTRYYPQIHTKDKELMLTMSSFIYLHHMCGRGCHALPRAPLEEGDVKEGAWSSLSSSVPRSVPVPFQVSRLLPKCRVIGFALDAFPEGLISLWHSVCMSQQIGNEVERQGKANKSTTHM